MAEPGITITGTQAVSSAVVLTLVWPGLVKVGEWVMQLRGQRAAQADSLSAQLNRLVDQLQEETTRASATARAYEADLKLLRSARWEIDDIQADLHNAVLAARTMVHELQRRLGEEETAFPPLPRPKPDGGVPRGP